MKNIVIFLFFFVVGTLGYRLLFMAPPEPQAQEAIEQEVVKEVIAPKPKMVVAEPKVQPKAVTVKPAVKQIKTTKQPASKPTAKATNPYATIPTTLNYEVINGFAISQGDIILGQVKGAQDGKTGEFKPQKQSLWPSPEIPYAVSKELAEKPEHAEQLETIRRVVEYFNTNTAVQLKPFRGEKDAIVFVPSDKLCASYLGQVGGLQPIYLSARCGFQQILHEVMHALGFIHEQSRSDRDQHVEVHWENIDPAYQVQFAMVPQGLLHSYTGPDFSFHFETIMIYPDTAFLKDRLVGSQAKSMTARDGEAIRSYANGLSPIDIQRIYWLYGR